MQQALNSPDGAVRLRVTSHKPGMLFGVKYMQQSDLLKMVLEFFYEMTISCKNDFRKYLSLSHPSCQEEVGASGMIVL
jgi:hypothetical protein